MMENIFSFLLHRCHQVMLNDLLIRDFNNPTDFHNDNINIIMMFIAHGSNNKVSVINISRTV